MIAEFVSRGGGQALLTRIHGRLADFLADNADCLLVHTDGQTPHQTYEALTAALGVDT